MASPAGSAEGISLDFDLDYPAALVDQNRLRAATVFSVSLETFAAPGTEQTVGEGTAWVLFRRSESRTARRRSTPDSSDPAPTQERAARG